MAIDPDVERELVRLERIARNSENFVIEFQNVVEPYLEFVIDNLDERIDALNQEIDDLEARVLILEGESTLQIDIGAAAFSIAGQDIDAFTSFDYQIDIGAAAFSANVQDIDSGVASANLAFATDFDSGWSTSPGNSNILLYETTDGDRSPPPTGCNATRFSLVADPTDAGRQVARLYSYADNSCLDTDGKHRTSFSMESPNRFWIPFNTEVWFGWKIYLDPSWPSSGDKEPIFIQFRPKSSTRNKTTGWTQLASGSTVGFVVDRHEQPTGSSRIDSETIHVSKGAWHTFTVRTKFTSDTSGYYYLWVDKASSSDTPNISWTGVQAQGNGADFKWDLGPYWGTEVYLPDTDLIMYIDYMRAALGANGFSSVQP